VGCSSSVGVMTRLRAGPSAFRIPAETRASSRLHNVQTGCGGEEAGVKAAEA
jgi:hypothetical protein